MADTPHPPPSPRSRAVVRYGSEFPPMTLFTEEIGAAHVPYVVRLQADADARDAVVEKARAYVECEDALAQDSDIDAKRPERPLDVLKRHGWNGVESIEDFVFRLRRDVIAALGGLA